MSATPTMRIGIVGTGEMGRPLVDRLLTAGFGIDEAHLARVLHTCSGQSYSLDLVAAMGSSDQLIAAAGRFIHKDIVVARQVAASIGASLGTIDAGTEPLLERTRPDH